MFTPESVVLKEEKQFFGYLIFTPII